MKTRYKMLIIIGITSGVFLIFPAVTQDCNALFIFPNAQCFVDSYHNCIESKISKTSFTVEGDPVYRYAHIVKEDKNSCHVEYFVDRTQDKFGSGKIDHYICNDVRLSENDLLFWCDVEEDIKFRL